MYRIFRLASPLHPTTFLIHRGGGCGLPSKGHQWTVWNTHGLSAVGEEDILDWLFRAIENDLVRKPRVKSEIVSHLRL